MKQPIKEMIIYCVCFVNIASYDNYTGYGCCSKTLSATQTLTYSTPSFWNSIRAVLNLVSILLQSMTLEWDLACMEWGWACSCDRNRFMTGLGMRSNSTCLQLLWIALTAEGRGCYSCMESTTYPVNCSLLFQSSIRTFWYL